MELPPEKLALRDLLSVERKGRLMKALEERYDRVILKW